MATRLLIAAAHGLSKEGLVAQFPALGGGPIQRTKGWTWCVRHIWGVQPNQLTLENVRSPTLVAATFDDEWWTLRLAAPDGESFGMASFHYLLDEGVGEWCTYEGEEEYPFHRSLTHSFISVAEELWPSFDAQDLAHETFANAAPEYVKRQGDALLRAASRLGIPHDAKELSRAMKGPFSHVVEESPVANLPLVLKALGVDALDPAVDRDEALVGQAPPPRKAPDSAAGPAPKSPATDTHREVVFEGSFATYRRATNEDVERASPMAAVFRHLGYETGQRERFAEVVFGLVPDPGVELEGETTRGLRDAFRDNGFGVLGALHCEGLPGGIVHAFAGPERECVGVSFQGTFGGGSIYVSELEDGSWLVTKTKRDMSCAPAIATENECHSPAWAPWPEHRDALQGAKAEGLRATKIPQTLESVTPWLDVFFAQQFE